MPASPGRGNGGNGRSGGYGFGFREGAAHGIERGGLSPPAHERGRTLVQEHLAPVAGSEGDAELTLLQVGGRPAFDAVRWAEAAFVLRPDVLVVDEPVSAELLEWWSGVAKAEDAPVEQVWTRS